MVGSRFFRPYSYFRPIALFVNGKQRHTNKTLVGRKYVTQLICLVVTDSQIEVKLGSIHMFKLQATLILGFILNLAGGSVHMFKLQATLILGFILNLAGGSVYQTMLRLSKQQCCKNSVITSWLPKL